MSALRTESTGRPWKLAMLVAFLLIVAGIPLGIATGAVGLGVAISIVGGAVLLVSAVGAWLTSG
jgi:hypothetical protein